MECEDEMTGRRKRRIKYTVEILVEGWADELPFFQEIADEQIQNLHCDITTARVCKDDIVRSATVEIKKKSKMISREILE